MCLAFVACQCRPQKLPKRFEIPNAKLLPSEAQQIPLSLPVPRNYVPNEYEREQNQAARYNKLINKKQ